VRATGSLAAARKPSSTATSKRRCAMPMCSTKTCATRSTPASPDIVPTRRVKISGKPSFPAVLTATTPGCVNEMLYQLS
jgi:hypothetical protein